MYLCLIPTASIPMGHQVHSYGPPGPYHLCPSIEVTLSSSSTQFESGVEEAVTLTVHRYEDFQWNRHLPEDFPLTRQQHEELIELFFKCFAFWGLRGHRESFHSAMREALSSTTTTTVASAHYGPMQHNAMLAIGMAFSPDPRLNNLDHRSIFVKKAQNYFLKEMETPTLSGVLALSYLSSFFSGIGKRSAASIYFGACASMAQVLGLGVDTSKVPSTCMSDREKNERDWLFWVLFFQDKSHALHLGRDMRIARPKEIRSPALSHEKEQYNIALFHSQTALFLVGTTVLETVYHRHRVTREMMSKLFNDVDLWTEQVPHHLTVPEPIRDEIHYNRMQLMLYLTHAWIRLCVHQPFYRCTPGTSRCVAWTSRAVRESNLAAARIMELFRIYDLRHNLSQIPVSAVPIAFLAGVIFIYQAEQSRGRGEERVAAIGRLNEVMRILSVMEKTWQCAGQPQVILTEYNRQLNSDEGESVMLEYDTSDNAFFQPDLRYSTMGNGIAFGTTPTSRTPYVPSEARPAHATIAPSPASGTSTGSSTTNPPRSHSVRKVHTRSFATIDCPSNWPILMQTLLPDSLDFIQPGAYASHGAVEATFNLTSTQVSSLPSRGTDITFQDADEDMPLHGSPRPLSSALHDLIFGRNEIGLSSMAPDSANGSGSTGAGRTSPQLRVHFSNTADARHPLRGFMMHERVHGGGRANSRPSSPLRNDYYALPDARLN